MCSYHNKKKVKTKKLWEEMDVFGIGCGEMASQIYMSLQLFNLYTLTMYSFLHVKHFSIE